MSAPPDLPVCPVHPDRETRLACHHCGRPACVECLDGEGCTHGRHLAAPSVPPPPAARRPGEDPADHPSAGSATPSSGPALRRRDRSPVVATGIIGVCVLLWVAGAFLPGIGLSLYEAGVQQQDLVAAGQPYRILTATLLHAGLTHLLFNMWALWVLGTELERRVGHLPFAALYLSAGIGGGALYQLIGGSAPVVGASGAIFGLFGAWLIAAYQARRTRAGRAGLQRMLVLLGLNAALPLFIPNIAWQAHLGGFLIGAAVAGAWLTPLGRSTVARTAVGILAAAGAWVAGVGGGG